MTIQTMFLLFYFSVVCFDAHKFQYGPLSAFDVLWGNVSGSSKPVTSDRGQINHCFRVCGECGGLVSYQNKLVYSKCPIDIIWQCLCIELERVIQTVLYIYKTYLWHAHAGQVNWKITCGKKNTYTIFQNFVFRVIFFCFFMDVFFHDHASFEIIHN